MGGGLENMRRISNGVVIHTGFMTYLLISVVILLGIAILSPALFATIINALKQLSSAATGH